MTSAVYGVNENCPSSAWFASQAYRQAHQLVRAWHGYMVRREANLKKLYQGLAALRCVAGNSQSVGDPRQIGERPSPHLSHHMAAMNLYGDLADAQFLGNQLVHHA